MPRPQKERSVQKPPLFSVFKPIGVRRGSLRFSALTLDEYEAIRLADYQGINHSEAADEMGISRSTFTRLIEKARHKLSVFIIEGRELQIEGGKIHFISNIIRCQNCGHMFNTDFDNEFSSCPACGSKDLLDLAGGFGHGTCCRRHNHHRRR